MLGSVRFSSFATTTSPRLRPAPAAPPPAEDKHGANNNEILPSVTRDFVATKYMWADDVDVHLHYRWVIVAQGCRSSLPAIGASCVLVCSRAYNTV